jgi:serine protease
VAIEIDEKDMLGLENDPEIEFVDLNLERSVFPSVQNADFSIVGQDVDREKHEKKKPLKDRRRLAETLPYGIVSVQADPNDNEGIAPGPFANDITVCGVDTGYDVGHEDFLPEGDRVTGVNGYGQRWDIDGHGHGTHCAVTIAAIGNNVKGVVGVIPNEDTISGIKLHIGKGLAYGGSGNSAGVLAAVAACVENGANIISISLGGGGYSQTENSTYEDVYLNNGVLIIAAAANGGNSGMSYPASYPSVMSVAAVDSRSYNRASFSQYNGQVEISGPGVKVESTIPGNKYASWNGTSMATPYVAGIAAFVCSYNTTCSAQ